MSFGERPLRRLDECPDRCSEAKEAIVAGRGKAWKGGEADPDGGKGRKWVGGPDLMNMSRVYYAASSTQLNPIFLSIDLH